MASALFRQFVTQVGEESNWRIESAGTWALEGAQAASGSVNALRSRGIDLKDHHARGVTLEMLEAFDLILTMELGHKEALRVEFPEFTSRIFKLSEMVDQEFDIQDPIGGTCEDFEETVETIERLLIEGFDRIRELAGSINPRHLSGS